jgi:chemotaxis protein methyltransferase CheR
MRHTNSIVENNRIDQLTNKIEIETGLSFAGNKRRDLKLAVHRMAESMGMRHDAECIDWLLSGAWDREKSDLCALHLTIGETYFFREPRAFGLVRDYAREKIQSFGADNARLRIWSAGCCTGEEPYSIAMTLRQSVPGLEPSRLSVLGTDMNADYLRLARAGVYRHWSFRNTEAALQNSNFSKEGEGCFRLNNEIREMVKFSELNLAAPVYPSVATDTHAMDIIFCRNVLMYFSRAQALKVIERFRQCLVNGGWLIVSPSEASAELFAGFSGVNYPDAVYFKKNDPLDALAVARRNQSSADFVKRRSNGILKDDVTRPGTLTSATRSARVTADTANIAAAPSGATGRSAKSGRAEAKDRHEVTEAGHILPAVYHARALIAIEAGDQHEAIQSLRRLLYLQPDSIIAHYLMGVVRSAQGKHREADRQFEIAKRLLAPMSDDEIVPESEGWSAVYLRDAMRSFPQKGGV